MKVKADPDVFWFLISSVRVSIDLAFPFFLFAVRQVVLLYCKSSAYPVNEAAVVFLNVYEHGFVSENRILCLVFPYEHCLVLTVAGDGADVMFHIVIVEIQVRALTHTC